MTNRTENITPNIDDEELIDLIEDETTDPHHAVKKKYWRILVIDDDESVHTVTRFALINSIIQGRPLELLHAHSAAEARSILSSDRDFAVILLDVVMETNSAGLELVAQIRNDYQMDETRIILRTGQPGYAPELSIFNEYDINDYRMKSELTQVRLITALTVAIRSYEQIYDANENRRGLELIVKATTELMNQQSILDFSHVVLAQIATLLKQPIEGIVCEHTISSQTSHPEEANRFDIIATTPGTHIHFARPLSSLKDQAIIKAIETCIKNQEHSFHDYYTIFYLRSSNQEGAVYIAAENSISATNQQLLKVFAANLSACFGNVKLVEQLNFTAYHDPLTHLPNRTAFIRTLGKLVEKHMVVDDKLAIALVDIDHFTDINDGMGHDFGDTVLIAVSDRLKSELAESCYVSRINSDLFGVIGPDNLVSGEHLIKIMEKPVAVAGYQLPIDVTLGLCTVTQESESAQYIGNNSGIHWLTRANIALNLAKKNRYGRSYAFFTPELEQTTRLRLEMIRWLRRDFEANTLAVWYQPQFSLTTSKIIGFEALIRWPDGHGSFVQPPNVFIPLAEYSGLIIDIGEWVLNEACKFLIKLKDEKQEPRRIAVNVSMPQFRMYDFAERVRQIAENHAILPEMIELEITESLSMVEPKLVIRNLQALKNYGFHVTIDDFGTGYSSLGYLHTLPIDCIKIDRSFVTEIGTGRGGILVETVIELSKKLGVTTTAEGVEKTEQAEFLRSVGCDNAQGYLYAKPLPFEELLSWLQLQN